MDGIAEMSSWAGIEALLPADLPPFVVPLAVGALLLLLAAWLVVRAQVPRKARPAGQRGGSLRGLGSSLARGVKWLFFEAFAVGHYLTTRREWRYRQPWVAMIGERGAGKSSIAESISLGRRETLLLKEQRLSAPDTEWVFFNRGVLVDIDGDTADDDDRRRWHRVLEAIDQYRPERPLDAAVLTLSADTLLHAGGAELHSLAERCYRQLWEMQKRLDLTFPVYLVISHCDKVPGFHAFWGAQPESVRRQIFGWSTPHALTNGFSPEWVDEAFLDLDQTLHGLQLGAAASGSGIDDPDPFFLFPQRFSALAAPLKVVLGLIFRSGSLHEDFYFRGLYFTGTAQPDDIHTETRVERTDIAFVDELFDERIFRETNLARPTRQGVLSRNRFIRRFQLATVATAAALVIALLISAWNLNEQISSARNAHLIIDQSKIERTAQNPCPERLTRRETLFALLKEIAAIDLDLRYWAIPASWFDSRINELNREKVANEAFAEMLFPAMSCALEGRADELADAAGRVTPKGDPSEEVTDQALAALTDYAADAAELADNVARFKRLGRDNDDVAENFEEFTRLMDYLYRTPLPPEVRRNHGLLRDALAHVEYDDPPRLPSGLKERVAAVLDARAAAAAEQLTLRVELGTGLLAGLEGHPTLDDVRELYHWLHWVRVKWLDPNPGATPCARVSAGLESPLATLKQLKYPEKATAVAERFDTEQCVKPAHHRLSALRVAPYGPLFVGERGVMTVTPWIERELEGFKALLEQDFMKVRPSLPFQCRLPIRGWREEKVAEAARYLRRYEAFAERFGLSLDGTDPRLFERLGREHLSAVVDDLFTSAQSRERVTGHGAGLASLSATEDEVAEKSEAFQRIIDPLATTLDKYRRLGFGAAQTRVLQCARDYAAQTLGRIESLADDSRLYEVGANFGELAEETPYFDLGTAAQTKEYLSRQFERSRVLAGYAQPFVLFLGNSAVVNDANRDTVDTGAYWDETIKQIDNWAQKKDPTSQPSELEVLISDRLTGLTPANCHGVLSDYARPAYGNDLFSRRRDQLTFLADWYCRDYAAASAHAPYQALAQRFNGELAGRFPFGPLESDDADPRVTRRFFLDYATQRAELDSALKGLDDADWGEAKRFIEQLDAAADLLGATLAAADGERPVALTIGFRHLPKRSPGSEQVIGWRFDSGLESAGYPNGEEQVSWRFGDSVALDLEWAELSPVRPIADGDQPDLAVSGRNAGFTGDGPWALLRLVQRHRVDYLSDPQKLVLGLTVPVRLEGTVPRQATALHAQMYLALSPSAIEPETQAEKPLAVPAHFPTEAPLPR